jgi:hypothetical protein
VGESENQDDAVIVATIDDSEKGGAIFSAEVQSLGGMNSIEGQLEHTVEQVKEYNTTKQRDGEQPEVSRQEVRDDTSILELAMVEEESAAIEPVEPLDERLGANYPRETEFQDDAVAAAKANEPNPEQEEASLDIEDATVGTGRKSLHATEEYEDISSDQRDSGVGTEDAVAVAQANESNPDVEALIHTPERLPVMENRDDALEIPDLLAD